MVLQLGMVIGLLAAVAAPVLRGKPEFARSTYHLPVAALLFFSMIRAVASAVLGSVHTRPLILVLLGSSFILAVAFGGLRRPAYQPIAILLAVVAVCFRNTEGDNLLLQSTLTTVVPAVLLVSIILTDVTRFMACLQWLGAALLPAIILLGDEVQGRLTLTGENAIWIGRMACLGCLGAVFNSRGSRVWRIATFASTTAILWLTESRGPLLALVASLFLYFALILSGARRALSVIAATAAVTTSVLMGYSVDFTSRSDSDVSAEWRWRIWLDSLNLFAKAPWIGAGRPVDDPSVGLQTYPHNFLLEVGIQGGLLAVLLLLTLIIQAWRHTQLPAMRCVLIGVAAFTLPSGTIWSSYELWLIVGMCAAGVPTSTQATRRQIVTSIAFRNDRVGRVSKLASASGAHVLARPQIHGQAPRG